MGSLTNQKIKDTYPGLIKTTDEGAINATPKALTDGMGNALPVLVGTAGMTYSGTQDFSGATLVGVPAGAKGDTGATGPAGPKGDKGDPGSGSASADYYNTTTPPLPVAGIDWFKLNVPALTFSGTGWTLGAAGSVRFTPVLSLLAGEKIDDVAVLVTTAVASSTLTLGLYSVTADANGLYASTLLTTFGTVDTSTTGKKVITGLNYTIPASAASFYYVGFLQLGGASAVSIQGPANNLSVVNYAALDATTMNRAMSVTGATGQSALPTTISAAAWGGYANNTTYAWVGFRN